MRHFTIATSSGIVWLMLVCHFGAALISLVAGTIALSVAKGGRLHKRSGLVFTGAMIATGVLAAAISWVLNSRYSLGKRPTAELAVRLGLQSIGTAGFEPATP